MSLNSNIEILSLVNPLVGAAIEHIRTVSNNIAEKSNNKDKDKDKETIESLIGAMTEFLLQEHLKPDSPIDTKTLKEILGRIKDKIKAIRIVNHDTPNNAFENDGLIFVNAMPKKYIDISTLDTQIIDFLSTFISLMIPSSTEDYRVVCNAINNKLNKQGKGLNVDLMVKGLLFLKRALSEMSARVFLLDSKGIEDEEIFNRLLNEKCPAIGSYKKISITTDGKQETEGKIVIPTYSFIMQFADTLFAKSKSDDIDYITELMKSFYNDELLTIILKEGDIDPFSIGSILLLLGELYSIYYEGEEKALVIPIYANAITKYSNKIIDSRIEPPKEKNMNKKRA